MPMRQEVIQNFFDVPGIAGIGLMNGVSPPFFHGFAAGLDFSQQEGVAQSIQQVLETTPEGFNSFEFQFGAYRIYLHKLNRATTLLVLTDNHLPRLSYMQEIRRLLLELQIGQENPIAEFQALAAHLPIPFKPSEPQADTAVVPPDVSPEREPTDLGTQLIAPAHPAPAHLLTTEPAADLSPTRSNQPETTELSDGPIDFQPVSVQEILAAMNALSQITTQYLGTLVVANYWKITCPNDDWLRHFHIERSGQMTFIVHIPSERLPLLTAEQHQSIQAWVAAFLERCSKVIRNFGNIVNHALDDRQKSLLLPLPPAV